jgi:hypothetical protein
MKHRRSLALLVPVAALGVVPALAAGGNGVSLSPPLIEREAKVGVVGAVTIANSTGQTMKVSVAVHPWLQSSAGADSPNLASGLPWVTPSVNSFTLGNGASRSVSLALVKLPPAGSVYGNVDVMAVPAHVSRTNDKIIFEYRLVGSLRLDPVHPSYGVRVGHIAVTGSRTHGTVAVALTNTGNTLATPGGDMYIRGALGSANAGLAPIKLVPGATVNVPVLPLDGSLPAGRYTLSGSVMEAGRRVGQVRQGFTIH